MKFLAESPEERARWFKALSIVTEENQKPTKRPTINDDDVAAQMMSKSEVTDLNPANLSAAPTDEKLNVGGKPIDLSTLTDISQFLSEQNNQLDGQLNASKQAQEALIADLDALLKKAGEQEHPLATSIAKVKQTTSQAWQQQMQSTGYMR